MDEMENMKAMESKVMSASMPSRQRCGDGCGCRTQRKPNAQDQVVHTSTGEGVVENVLLELPLSVARSFLCETWLRSAVEKRTR